MNGVAWTVDCTDCGTAMFLMVRVIAQGLAPDVTTGCCVRWCWSPNSAEIADCAGVCGGDSTNLACCDGEDMDIRL